MSDSNQREIVYWKNSRSQWEQFTLVSKHEWNQTATIENGVGQVVCRQSELINEEQYTALKKEEEREYLRKLHQRLIELWGSGPAKPSRAAYRRRVVICAEQIGKTPSGVGRTIAALKRWGIIK